MNRNNKYTMAASVSIAIIKSLLIVFMCIMFAGLSYMLVTDGDKSCFDLNALWTLVGGADFNLFIILIAAWFFYKESSWIKRLVFLPVLFWTGSFVTCGYIVFLLFKLSSEESTKDPFYYVLVRRQNRDVTEHMTQSPVLTVAAKVIVTVMGCYILGVTIYAYIVDGLPFFMEVLSPCMIAMIPDIIIYIVLFSMWIAYKESSWISAICWILLLICFRGIGLSVYVLRELFSLSPGQHISFIVFNKNKSYTGSSDPLLITPSDV